MVSKKSESRGGTNRAGGGSDGGDVVFGCDISGIRPEALAHMWNGFQLDFRIDPGEPCRSVVCDSVEGGFAGAPPTFPRHGKLIRCLERGAAYVVAVELVDAGRCHVGAVTQ